MMLWALLFLVFLIQEPVSSSGILLEAYQHGYNVWFIHALFVLATLIDVLVGYAIGIFLRKRFGHIRATRFLKDKVEAFTNALGKYGKRIALIVFAPAIFPISALLPPFLGISLIEAAICLLIGDLIFWYGLEWILVLGVKTLGFDPHTSLYLVLILTAGVVVIKQFFWKQLSAHQKP